MEIVYSIYREKNIDVNKKIYTCSQCSNIFNWNKESSWFGSYRNQEEHPERIINICSKKCETDYLKQKQKKQIK